MQQKQLMDVFFYYCDEGMMMMMMMMMIAKRHLFPHLGTYEKFLLTKKEIQNKLST